MIIHDLYLVNHLTQWMIDLLYDRYTERLDQFVTSNGHGHAYALYNASKF